MRRDSRFRFIINTSQTHLEVHDLDDERNGCQIDELVEGGNFQYLLFNDIKSLEDWLGGNPGYDGCAYCLSEHHED